MARTCISQRQRNLHVRSETAAVLWVAPLLGWVALSPTVSRGQRAALGAVAIGTVLVDGALLRRYRRA